MHDTSIMLVTVLPYNGPSQVKLLPKTINPLQKNFHQLLRPLSALKLFATAFTWLIFTNVAIAQVVEPASTAPVPDTSQITIVEGQITNYIGGGVKDVVITAHRKNDDDTKGKLIAETKTDEIGDFALKVSEEYHGEMIITISKKTFQTITHNLKTSEDEFPLFVADTLQGTLQLRGVVRSIENHKPVEGANIFLSTGYQDFQATSDALGAFLLKNLSPGQADLTVSAKGFGRERIPIQSMVSESEDELDVILKPERIISLFVRDELNHPISGVTIELYDKPRDDLQTIVTNAEGKAIVSGIHFDADALRARLTHENYVSSDDYDHTITLSKDAIVSHHELHMQRAGKISGLVLDENNQPLSGARIMAGNSYTDTSPRDWSTYDGSYTIGQVPPGPTFVTVQLNGYAPQLKKAHIQPGKVAHVEFLLKPGVSLVGVVRTEDGEAVAGAEIITTTWRGAETLGLRAMTDALGRFDMRGAPLGKFEILAITPNGHRKTLLVSVIPNQPVSIIVPTAPPAPRHAKGPAVGDDVPAITLTTLTGKSLNLKNLKGKTILIDFWATWCGPCVAELPELEGIYKEFQKHDDFVMISVSQDFDLSTLKRFLRKRKKMAWPQVYNGVFVKHSPTDVFGVDSFPTVYIIGADGKIAAKGLRGPAIGKKIHDILKE